MFSDTIDPLFVSQSQLDIYYRFCAIEGMLLVSRIEPFILPWDIFFKTKCELDVG